MGDKVLKSNAKNSHRLGGKLEKPWLGPNIIHIDLDKGRLPENIGRKIIEGNHPLCSLNRFLDPVDILD